MNLPGGLEITWLDSPLATAYQEILLHIRGPNGFKLPARSEEFLTKLSPKVVVLLLVAFFFIVKHLYTSWKLRVNVPYVTVGRGPYWVRSWRTAVQWVIDAKSIVDRGYYEHRDTTGAFQIPTLSGNHVFICSNELIDEFRNAPDDVLSFGYRTADILQARYTIGMNVLLNAYHIPFIRDQLTKGMDRFTEPLREEFGLAMDQHMNLNTGEWKAFKAYDFVTNVIVRGMSRVFVGMELCRNKEYLDTTLAFTQQLFIAAHVLQLVPPFLKYPISPLINEMFINKPIRTSKRLLAPLIKERKRRAEIEGENWEGKPHDMLQWIIEGAPESEQNIDALVMRMTEVNMAALHTTAITLYQNLCCLAVYSDHIPELRQEMEQSLAQYGWSKVAMSKMYKLDSFMRETERLQGPSVIVMGRKVIGKGFTFSNGLRLPAGTTVSIPETIHTDEQEYGDNAQEFDGFRFSQPLEVDEAVQGLGNTKVKRKYFTTTAVNYLRFGHGHGACPGRFFASHEIKIILCLILTNYDIQLEDTPKPMYFTMHRGPDMNARIAFRKRKTS